MTQEPNLKVPELNNHTIAEFNSYVHLLTMAVDWAHKNRGATDPFSNDEPGTIICTSWLLSDHKSWEKKFRHYQKSASNFYHNWNTYQRDIAIRLLTPEIKKECLQSFPNLDWGKYFGYTITTPTPKEITPRAAPTPKKKQLHKRGELWKLDTTWDHLWPSSRKVFTEMLRRYQFSKRPDAFPWCQAGIKSLHKFTGVSERQIERALTQLEQFKLIKRIVKGNEFQGCSKYLIFITPKTSGAFSWKSLHARNDQPPKKRIVRMR